MVWINAQLYYLQFPKKCHQNIIYISPLYLWQIRNSLSLWIDTGPNNENMIEWWHHKLRHEQIFIDLMHTKIMRRSKSNHSLIHNVDPTYSGEIQFLFGLIQRGGVSIENKKIHPKFSFHQFQIYHFTYTHSPIVVCLCFILSFFLYILAISVIKAHS